MDGSSNPKVLPPANHVLPSSSLMSRRGVIVIPKLFGGRPNWIQKILPVRRSSDILWSTLRVRGGLGRTRPQSAPAVGERSTPTADPVWSFTAGWNTVVPFFVTTMLISPVRNWVFVVQGIGASLRPRGGLTTMAPASCAIAGRSALHPGPRFASLSSRLSRADAGREITIATTPQTSMAIASLGMPESSLRMSLLPVLLDSVVFFILLLFRPHEASHQPEQAIRGAAGERARTVVISNDPETTGTLLAEPNPRRSIRRHRHAVVIQSTGERGSISGPRRTDRAAWGSWDSQL